VNFNNWLQFKKNKYTKLLLILLCLFFAASLVNNWLRILVVSSCFLGASLAVLETLYLSRKGILSLRAIAIIAFFCSVIDFPQFPRFSNYISAIGNLGYTLFMILAILVIQKRINSAQNIDMDIIRGGICIYLILGFLWSIFYMILCQLDPSAFKGLVGDDANHKLFYFSFTTLTTLGYGDILPVAPLAMTLTNLEAIIGQLYPAIAIAKLVSLYSSADSAKATQEKEIED